MHVSIDGSETESSKQVPRALAVRWARDPTGPGWVRYKYWHRTGT